ncbi:hypothetical protein GQ44DRAFT_827923 [Phaeosphaeriaceae sp. PMI808]|nr:hypothetical protein GQ44DRAFT_827923 [Phaeosphaeriaceae sp. PMI808]
MTKKSSLDTGEQSLGSSSHSDLSKLSEPCLSSDKPGSKLNVPSEVAHRPTRCASVTSENDSVPDQKLEPFPKFIESEDLSGSGESPDSTVPIRTLDSQDQTHCPQHCQHPVCRRIRLCNMKKGIATTCKIGGCKANVPKTGFDETEISNLKHEDFDAAYIVYDSKSKDDEIKVHLPSALAIIRRMKALGELNLHYVFLHDPAYTTDCIFKTTRHATASLEADTRIFCGINRTLRIALMNAPGETGVFTIGELQERFTTSVKIDCASWMGKWVWRENGCLNRLSRDMERKEAYRVLVDLGIECGVQILSLLVWWDEQKKLAPESVNEENGDS